MRQVILLAAVAGVCGAHAITVQNEEPATVRTSDGTLVVNNAAPKYTLNEAIEICIAELEQRGETVSAGSVKNRLQRMPKSDVDLDVKGLARTIREVIEAHEVANRKTLPEPKPADYDTREKFVAAYVEWKTGGLTPSERKALRAKLGGDAKFRNDAKRAADKIWKANQDNTKGKSE